MWNTFKYTILSIMRERSIVIWTILFPLILATLFNVMFGGIEENAHSIDPIRVAIVDESQDGTGEMFLQTLDALSGDDALVDPIEASTQDEALELLNAGEAIGIATIDREGWPSLQVSPDAGDMSISMAQIERTILADIVNNFCRSRATAEDIVANDPAALADQRVIESFTTWDDYTEQIAITHSKTTEYVRYFYALLGFAALMAAMVGLNAVCNTLPNISPLGARRTVGGTSRSATLAGAITAAWLISFASLLAAFAYIRCILGVEFGGRDAACILGLAMGALMVTSLGAFIGAIPSIPFAAKGGMLTGVTCLLSLFAGLYGTPSMNFADQVARDVPWLSAINPAKQVTDLFYSLYVYTDASYTILLSIAVCTAVVMSRFGRDEVRKRNEASPIPVLSTNLQFAAADCEVACANERRRALGRRHQQGHDAGRLPSCTTAGSMTERRPALQLGCSAGMRKGERPEDGDTHIDRTIEISC